MRKKPTCSNSRMEVRSTCTTGRIDVSNDDATRTRHAPLGSMWAVLAVQAGCQNIRDPIAVVQMNHLHLLDLLTLGRISASTCV